jgi:hypothetical protein
MCRAPVVVVVVACLGGAACGPDLPDRLIRSEHVRYFSRPGDRYVCPALLDVVEEHGQVIAERLGIERTVVTYYKYGGIDDFDANAECGRGAAACAPNATVRSPGAFDRHELVHAYLASYGRPPPLFIEGAAVALSCDHYARPTGSWRDALTYDRLSSQFYGAGGWLVGYLLRMFRKTWFVNLYGGLQENATADEIAKVFEDIYGLSLDGVWAAAIGGPQEPMSCPWECGRPAFAADGQPHPLAGPCDSGGTLQLTVAVPGEGVTRWLLDGFAEVSVQSCNGYDSPLLGVAGTTSGGTAAMLAPLAADTYFINANVPVGAPVPLAVDTNALPALSSYDCASAPVVPDDISRYSNLTLFFPSSVGPQFTSFAVGTSRLADVLMLSDDRAAKGGVCTGCDAQTCTAVDGSHSASAATPAGTVLSIPPGEAVTASIYWYDGISADGGAR